MTDMIQLLRDAAADQDRLREQLERLQQAGRDEAAANDAFRQNLQGETTELRRELHGQVESLRETGALTQDIVGGYNNQFVELRETLQQQLDSLSRKMGAGFEALDKDLKMSLDAQVRGLQAQITNAIAAESQARQLSERQVVRQLSTLRNIAWASLVLVLLVLVTVVVFAFLTWPAADG